MPGFLGEEEKLTRDRVKEIIINKEYSYLEEKVSLEGIEGDNLIFKISLLLDYKKQMIFIEEKDKIVIPYKEFKVENWGEGIRKIEDII
ncbi:MAG: hypothetical protein AB1711_03610 [Thermodesulfobacteriota bacterium]